MLINYIKSELSSAVGFLRARACWTYSQFAAFPYTDKAHQTEVV
jgi:hypothetical protein